MGKHKNEEEKNVMNNSLNVEILFYYQTKKKLKHLRKGFITSFFSLLAFASLLLKLFELSFDENYYFFIIFQWKWCIMVDLIIYCLPLLSHISLTNGFHSLRFSLCWICLISIFIASMNSSTNTYKGLSMNRVIYIYYALKK